MRTQRETPPRSSLERSRGRRVRRGRLLAGAVALGIAGSMLAASPGVAVKPPPDGPVGAEPTQPTNPWPTAAPDSAPGSLAAIVARASQSGGCPANGPAAPWTGDQGTNPAPGRRVVRIVISGDSYMSGEGAGQYLNANGVLPPPMVPTYVPGYGIQQQPAPGYTLADYQDDWRHRSRDAAALLAIDQLRTANSNVDFQVTFNASSGAETKNYFVPQDDGYRSNPAQDAGLDGQTDLVVIGFGGNDIGFGPLVQTAMMSDNAQDLDAQLAQATALLAPRPDADEWNDALVPGTPTTLVARYIQMIRDIHAKTGADKRVMMVSYPQGIVPGLTPAGLMGSWIKTGEREKLATLAPGLADAMRRAQQILVNHHVQVDLLDIQNAFSGHQLGSADPYINAVTVDPAGPNLFAMVQQTAHPNLKGTQSLAAHYASMIATELGVAQPASGPPPTGGVANPCQPGLAPASSTDGGSGSSGTAGSGGGSSTGGGSTSGGTGTGGVPGSGSGGANAPAGTAPGGNAPGGNAPGGNAPGGNAPGGDGGDSGNAGNTGDTGDSGDNGDNGDGGNNPPGYGDIDPVTPVQPTDPAIPDGLDNPPPTIPLPPDGGGHGEAPMDEPSILVIPNG